VIVTLLGVSIALQVYFIYPYLPVAPRQAPSCNHAAPGRGFSLITSNVLQFNRDATRLLALVGQIQPDTLLLVESDDWWEEQMRGIEETYSYRIKRPLSNTYGMLLYSRLELQQTEIRFLIEDGIPSIFTTARLSSGIEFHLICLHPRPPRPDKMQDSTNRDAELLIAAKYIQHRPGPYVVMGDFNDVAWSYTTRLFQRISGLLDPRRGRGFFNSFHADYPLLRYPLDHIFHSPHFRLVRLKRLPHIGSDHFPIFAEFSYEPDPDSDAQPPRVEKQDEREARAMIREAFERLKKKARVKLRT
jgi:endonuclease/exonuclease/phosphatase (EEP) superfamily protein YafD